jgi:hypothetical protein
MASHGFGTDIRRGFNARMLGEAIKQPGLDTRYWVSEGTVGTVNTETGDFDPQDKRAIHNDSSGCHVDVLLEPLMIPCTCQYAGIQAGDVTIYAPIRPGNRVVVSLPDGDLTGGIITAILNSRSMRQPTKDRKPIFDNNRLLIHAQSVPIDIRTASGSQVCLLQDGTVRVGNQDASHPEICGDTFKTKLDDMLGKLESALSSVQPVAVDGGTAIGIALSAISALVSEDYLSKTVKVYQ